MRAITLDFLEGALARKVPIGAYGMQGHLAGFGPPLDQRKLRSFLESLKAMGLHVLITEHDVYDTGGPLDTATRDRAVADASARFMDVVLDRRMVDTVLTWGLSDKFIDPPGWRERLAGYTPRMLPLDSDFQRKPMWTSLAASFDRT
jgi:endo-1,4-beta-xylanase